MLVAFVARPHVDSLLHAETLSVYVFPGVRPIIVKLVAVVRLLEIVGQASQLI